MVNKKNNLIKNNHKLVSVDELIKIKSKGNKSLIICHGVFDVVHPGHVRHLIYAKSRLIRPGLIIRSVTPLTP